MAKSTKSTLQQRIEEESAREAIRYEKPKAPGGGSLPAGIDSGVALLTRIDFDVIDKGDYEGEQRFYCHGTCVAPKEHEGIPVFGKLVQVGTITLADTVDRESNEVSFKVNLAKAENRLKLLGFPTEDFDNLEEDSLAYFQANGSSMYFEFSTWKPEDGDRVVTMLRGPIREFVPDDDDGVEEAKPAPKAKAAPKAEATKPPKAKKVVEAEVEVEEEEEVDLKATAKKADKGDKKAQLALSEAAKELGIDPEGDEFDNWTSVFEAIEAAKTKPKGKPKATQKEEPEEAEPIVPTKGQVYGYKPNPKSKKVVECEVIKVLKRDQTVDLRSLSDDEEYEGVEWAELIEVQA